MNRYHFILFFSLALASPAFSQMIFSGDASIALRPSEDQNNCEQTFRYDAECPVSGSKESPTDYLPQDDIVSVWVSGEMKMGMIYDGSKLMPHSDMGISFNIRTNSDSGPKVGATLSQ